MFNSTISSFGLDISELSLKIAQLKKVSGGFYLQAWNNMMVPKGVIENGNIVDEKRFIDVLESIIKKTAGKVTTKYVVLCLPETKTFIKLVQVDYSQQELATALEGELTRHIPIPISELHYDWQLLTDDVANKKANILVGAAPTKLINTYTGAVKKIGLSPVALEIEAQSIVNSLFGFQKEHKKIGLGLENYIKQIKTRFGKQKTDNNTKQVVDKNPARVKPLKAASLGGTAKIIIDLGATRSSLILYDHGTIQFTSSSETSGINITQQIMSSLKLDVKEAERAKLICGLDPKKAKGKLKNVLSTCFENLVKDVDKMTIFYNNHFPHASSVEQIVLTGGGANMINLVESLRLKLNIEIVKGYPLKGALINNKIKPIPDKEMLTFSTAIGLALRYLIIDQ